MPDPLFLVTSVGSHGAFPSYPWSGASPPSPHREYSSEGVVSAVLSTFIECYEACALQVINIFPGDTTPHHLISHYLTTPLSI